MHISGEQLMRTKSMQPMASTTAAQLASKKALGRTKSHNPNLVTILEKKTFFLYGTNEKAK